MSEHAWIIPMKGTMTQKPTTEVYCFHHAGGSAASFSGWMRDLPEGVSCFAINLPPAAGDMSPGGFPSVQALMPDLLQAFLATRMRQGGQRPFLLYGHSLGASSPSSWCGHCGVRISSCRAC